MAYITVPCASALACDRAFPFVAAIGMNFPATPPLPSLWRLSVVSVNVFVSFIISGFIIYTARHLCNCSLYININNGS